VYNKTAPLLYGTHCLKIVHRKSGKIQDGDKMMIGQGEQSDEEIVLLQRQTVK